MRTQTLEGNGRLVVLSEPDYLDLLRRAGANVGENDLPEFPARDAAGNSPASEYARVSIARDIITERKRLHLTQAELAKLAGMNPETLNRIERATVSASNKSIDRIESALKKAAKKK